MKRSQKKINNKIMVFQLLEFILLCIACYVWEGNKEYFFVVGTLMVFGFMMIGIFRYILNTESYDLLGGVNTKKYRYDVKALDKILLNIEFIILVNGIVIGNVIMCFGLFALVPETQEDRIPFICFGIYVVGTIIGICAMGRRIKATEEK